MNNVDILIKQLLKEIIVVKNKKIGNVYEISDEYYKLHKQKYQLPQDRQKVKYVTWLQPQQAHILAQKFKIPSDKRTKKKEAFRYLGYDSIKQLFKIQNKLNTISTTKTISSRIFTERIYTGSGIVAIISGNYLVGTQNDLGSMPDKNGNRWLQWDSPETKEIFGKDYNNWLKQIKNLTKKYQWDSYKTINKKQRQQLLNTYNAINEKYLSNKQLKIKSIQKKIDDKNWS